jgi:hypothetical protein
MPIYVVNRSFENPLKVEDFAAAGKVLMPCLEARDVKWVSSHLSSDGTHSICVYEAVDAESVREANRTAGMPFDKVWQAVRFTP